MINLDRINVESATWAAERIRERHPLPGRQLSDMTAKESDAWLRELHEQRFV